ncbi:mCG118053 [Mus musculus]|nr:mCG118053 [Mus musculus]
METRSEAGVLQKLLERLCQETDPGKIYKTLKELSSLPILCDTLAEIDFKQTIKSLKKQQLLVPFVKDLVDKWSTGFLLGPQIQQARQDFGLEKGLKREGQSTSSEEKPQKQASQEARGYGREQKHTGTRDSGHCQVGKDKAGRGQPEEKSRAQGHRYKESYSHPESPTPLQVQGSQEERLQALRARLQSTRAKRPQPRQTMMVSFFTELKSPSQQGKPGKSGDASVQNQHSFSEVPAHPGVQWASCPLAGETGTKKAPAKRPAPLMAKTLKDYRKCFYKR